MSKRFQHIFTILRQLPFLLVLGAILIQPVIQTYSLLSDASYEFVDYDLDDDTEEEIENTSEQDEKVTHRIINFLLADYDLLLYNSHFYVQRSGLLYNIEILIPPPEFA